MLQIFRKSLKSKLGAVVALAFLVLIALAFASADITGSGNFGGVAGGDRVASVGKQRVDTSELSQAATNALENIRQDDPKISMKAFLAQGGLESVLEQLIDRSAIGAFGEKYGLLASARLVDSEIAQMDAFKGPDGKFNDAAFRQTLQQRGISEALVRDDLEQGLVARQILVPAAFGAIVPQELATRYATLLLESRNGAVAVLPAAAFAPKTPPTDAEVQAFYAKNTQRFIRPERRTIRYAIFGDDVLKNLPAPTEAEIAARYAANKSAYAASENRRITQLIVPTEAAAKAIAAEVAGGASLEKAAANKGLATAALNPIGKEALAAQTSRAVADAAFAAGRGTIAAPARSGLGWHVLRIDAVEQRAERTMDQVRNELVPQILAEKRRSAINELSSKIEEEFDQGGTLGDTAKELGLTVAATEQLTADGQVYAKPGEAAPAMLGKVMSTAFAMEKEGEPQLAEIEAGKTFIIFDVTDIQPSAPAPLAEIRNDVVAALMIEKGAAAAREAADKVLAQTRKGTDLSTALASLGVALPPVERVTMSRQQLAAMQNNVPAPIGLMFSMAKGTTKLLPAPGGQGWFVVSLKDIIPGKVDAANPLVASARRELGLVAGREYAEALRRAIRAEVGVERNPAAIRAVRNQLDGTN
ncbi:MAG: peptidyl-prolyl cis-trans isomerase [Novosphingobium sp.]